LHAAYLILQLSARALERIVDGEIQIRAPFVFRRGSFDVDFATVGKRKPDMDVVKPTRMMPLARTFHHDAASRHATPTLLKTLDVLCDGVSDSLCRAQILKLDLRRRLHFMLQGLQELPADRAETSSSTQELNE